MQNNWKNRRNFARLKEVPLSLQDTAFNWWSGLQSLDTIYPKGL